MSGKNKQTQPLLSGTQNVSNGLSGAVGVFVDKTAKDAASLMEGVFAETRLMLEQLKTPLRRWALGMMALAIAVLGLFVANVLVMWRNGHLVEKGLPLYWICAVLACILVIAYMWDVGKTEVAHYLSVQRLGLFLISLCVFVGFVFITLYWTQALTVYKNDCPNVFSGAVNSTNIPTSVAGFGWDYGGILCFPENWGQFLWTSILTMTASIIMFFMVLGPLIMAVWGVGDLFNEVLATGRAAREKYNKLSGGGATTMDADSHVEEILQQLSGDIDHETVHGIIQSGDIEPLMSKIEETRGKKFRTKHEKMKSERPHMVPMRMQV
jgi:hypothetical protein